MTNDWITFLSYMQGGRNKTSRPLANNTRVELREGDAVAVKLHATDVVTYHPDGRVVLHSGGWQTATTKERMNTYSPLTVWSDKGVWCVARSRSESEDPVYTFQDGITLHPDGRITGAGPSQKVIAAQRKRIVKYVDAYLAKLVGGTLGAPSGRDCWFCLLFPDTSDTEHIHAHVREAYYVPSLILRAADAMGMSQAEQGAIVSRMQGERGVFEQEGGDWRKSFLWRGVRRRFTKYLYRAHGLAA